MIQRNEKGQFIEGNQASKKRQCLWCRKNISDRRPEARFCNPSHKTLWHREKSAQIPIVTHKKSIFERIKEVVINGR